MAKNKQKTFAEIAAEYQPETKAVDIGGNSVMIQELSGRQRFELSERTEDPRWDTMLWVCMQAIIDPKPDDVDALEKMDPEWIIKIANEVMAISGVEETDETVEQSENA